MVYKITSDCIACGVCSVICPMDAIDDGYTGKSISASCEGHHADEGLSEIRHYSINYNCDQCGQCVDACPAEAIVYE